MTCQQRIGFPYGGGLYEMRTCGAPARFVVPYPFADGEARKPVCALHVDVYIGGALYKVREWKSWSPAKTPPSARMFRAWWALP